MKGDTGNIIKIACIYITTIIGAGFASGQEIVQFFSNYYHGGFYGIILAGMLFAIIGYVVLDKVYRERIRNYEELLFPSVGWFMGWVIEIAVSLFMLSVFCIMIAGSASVLFEKLAVPFNYGIVIVTVVCMLAILSDIKGIVAISTFITPVLVIGIIAVGVFVISCNDTSAFSAYSSYMRITKNWFFSSLLYVGYNSIIAIVVMCSLLTQIKSRKAGVMGGMIGGLVLCAIALLLNTAIFIFNPDTMKTELPVLSITAKFGNMISGFYSIVLLLAMFTSAITSGYGFIERIGGKLNINRKLLIVICCAAAMPLSSLGFSNLISYIYPVFGYIGIFLVIVILAQNFKIKPFGASKKRNM